MHELAITQNVVDAVADHVGGRQVTAVYLRIGRLSGIVPDSVRFCYEMVTEGTTLAGSRLGIDERDGSAWCRDCQQQFPLAELIPLCPCGSANVEVISGRELSVASVELAEEE